MCSVLLMDIVQFKKKIYAYKTQRYSSYAIQTRNYTSFQKKIANTYIAKTCLFGVPVHHPNDVADLIQNE